MVKLVKVELLALVKKHNKYNKDKILNADKMHKNELLAICKEYSLLSTQYGSGSNESNGSDGSNKSVINFKNVSKSNLFQDIEFHFLKQNKKIPTNFSKMKKSELIEYMEINDICHYTKEMLEKEVKKYHENITMKNIIYYNILKYDDIDVNEIDDLRTFIEEKNLDTNIEHFTEYSALVQNLYTAYSKYCTSIGCEITNDKIKSMPKILYHLKHL
jgi:hypothetical protein